MATGQKALKVRDGMDATWRTILTWGLDDMCFCEGFTKDGSGLYLR
jgi:hypothetical protein